MQVLYYMDVFIDLDKSTDERSFVAKFDLNADFLGRYSNKQKDLKSHLFSSGFCFGKKRNKTKFNKE
ncbi:putative capsular polysaccharide modification protein [Escherichia coli]|uniref:Putative capsular polysaccharide modification protein n=1 Tax=Escherichia coli TaxID=562 RepID=A0A377K2I7_ECOLX|nr:putative capsular polysaccharide modification protein [Escherichia coli]